MAEEVLLEADRPLTPREVWETGVAKGLSDKLKLTGQTPWDSLSSALFTDPRDNPNSAFIRLPGSPARFCLRDQVASQESLTQLNMTLSANPTECEEIEEVQLEEDVVTVKDAQCSYKERELHPFLSWFAKYTLGAIVTKTLRHENSYKRRFAQWLHPDLVGMWFPFQDYVRELLDLSGPSLAIVRFYSFEMKCSISFANLRESFFQAVSNSSWANEGYLVAADIAEDENLRRELRRLSGSFGIGVIELDICNLENSRVLFPARRKTDIDWDGANKLAVESPDFRAFLHQAHIDRSHCKLHPSEYDQVPSLEELAAKAAQWTAK
jgi:hypothetical protein